MVRQILPTQSKAPVLVIGGGPAGCTMAILLAESGRECIVLEDGNTPDMIVGESLIPAVVPVLKRLGVTDAVDKVCNRKPGVTFLHDELEPIEFRFPNNRNGVPNFSWNAPRPTFDNILRERAIELGAHFVLHRANLENGIAGGNELVLGENTLAAIGLNEQPSFIIDATGRVRLAAKTLGIEATRGKRTDISHFAHFTGGMRPDPEGTVVIIRLAGGGWAWVIPLPDRVSIGIVVGKEIAKSLGATAEERLATVMANEPLLRPYACGAKRISNTATYSNYQLTSTRGHGAGWASVGDAYGFVDPMLSSGLFMGLESARSFFDATFGAGLSPDDTQRWSKAADGHYREMGRWLRSWEELISYFYNGDLFRLCQAGGKAAQQYNNSVSRFMERQTSRRISGMASGATTRSAINKTFLRLVIHHLTWNTQSSEELMIR